MKIEYNVNKIRVDQNLSVRELADLSGVSKSQINSIENGLKHPTVYTLCLLAQALKESPYHLFAMIEEQ